MKLEELLAMLPKPITEYERFDLQYLGLGEWVLHCWTCVTSPTSGSQEQVLYKIPRPLNDPHGKRWDHAPRSAIYDLKKLQTHHEAMKKVLG